MGTTLLENYSKKEVCPVTGLLNMMQFMRHASLHLQDPMTRPLTFIYFDIENFKSFNQRYSFQQGNRFLRYVADLLRETFPGDLLSRFNDDHFVVATPIEQPDRQVRFIHDHVRIYDTHLPLELKAGIYRPDADVTDVARIVDRAKIACNSIKNTYDLVWAVFDPSMEEELNFRSYIVRNFSKAIMGGHIVVYYQPEIRTMTRELCGFEALARWHDPVYGAVPPSVFVPVLEDAHLSPQLDLYVIDQVCASMVQIQRDIPDWSLLRISVNLSRADFRLMDMVQAVEDVRQRHGVARQMLNIEVTEGVQGDDETFLQGEIARFRALGYEVWMDDFGSGYSSLNNIKDYVFDVLKIDMNFLRSFETNPKSAIVIRSIVNMAKELGMHTLAEGVETEAQFEFLREIGCEKVQGYLFSPPIPSAEAIAYCHGPTARVKVEPFRLGSYYARVGAINVLSNTPLERRGSPEIGDSLALAILEDCDGSFKYLYQNHMFRLFMKSIELYDRVDLLDLNRQRLTQVYCSVTEPSYLNKFDPLEELLERYGKAMVLPAELPLYQRFYSMEHLQSLLLHADAENTILLHKRLPDGTRVLRLHHLIPFRMEDRDYIISCIQQVDENVINASLTSFASTAVL